MEFESYNCARAGVSAYLNTRSFGRLFYLKSESNQPIIVPKDYIYDLSVQFNLVF